MGPGLRQSALFPRRCLIPKGAGYFSLPIESRRQLEALVDRIEAAPGDLIDLQAFKEKQQCLDLGAVLHVLPPGLSEDDFVGVLRLALLTECATESYTAVIRECARRFDAPWLGRFNENVWTPDELTH